MPLVSAVPGALSWPVGAVGGFWAGSWGVLRPFRRPWAGSWGRPGREERRFFPEKRRLLPSPGPSGALGGPWAGGGPRFMGQFNPRPGGALSVLNRELKTLDFRRNKGLFYRRNVKIKRPSGWGKAMKTGVFRTGRPFLSPFAGAGAPRAALSRNLAFFGCFLTFFKGRRGVPAQYEPKGGSADE